jgi:hypothetical protein
MQNFAVLLIFVSITSWALVRDNALIKSSLPYKPGYVLVKTVDGASRDALDSTAFSLGALLQKEFTLVPGLLLFEYDGAYDIQEIIDAFKANNYVDYAEPDYYYHIATTNDPRFREEWALENTGQTGGTPDVDLNAHLMWQIENGDPKVVIGVIDTGVDYSHADLMPNLLRNPAEIPANNIDDDSNGYVDDIFGINAINNSGKPLDDNAHGTHVSGTIGADGNNFIGISGVAQNIRIMSCKFLDANGSGSTSDAIQCLQYFANLKTRAKNPINIVATNNSWGSSSSSNALRDAIKAHEKLGILFVAAAGNEAANNDISPSFPANYELSNIISVAATDHKDTLASFSNYGKRSVHVGAPGVRILSTVLNQGYALLSGTSMATPHVTGLIAIIKSAFPSLDARQIKNLVLSSGVPISSLQNKSISGRRIRGADTNGRGALTCSHQLVNARLKPVANYLSIALGSSVLLSSLRLNCDAPNGTVNLYSDPQEILNLQDDGSNGDQIAHDGVYSLLWTPLKAQTYTLNFGNGDSVLVNVSGINKSTTSMHSTALYSSNTSKIPSDLPIISSK